MSQFTDTTEYKISEQFDRLGVSTNQDTNSGLVCGKVSSITAKAICMGEDVTEPVAVYGGQPNLYYHGIKLLEFLKDLDSANMDNIWQLIEPFKI